MWEPTGGANFYGVNKKILRRSSNLEICLMVSQGRNNTFGQIQERWFGPFKVENCLPKNIVLIYVNNFEPTLVLVSVNKLKPHIYICGSNIEGDSEFRRSKVFIGHRFKQHGRNIS
jgi:hypothetical protein